MKKVAILLIILFILSTSTPIFVGPFSDVKSDHWTYKTVKELSIRGLPKGYPNYKLDDNKTITRYEMAQIVARLIETGRVVEDYSTLKKLIIEFTDELALLGINITILDDEERKRRMGQGGMKAQTDARKRNCIDKKPITNKVLLTFKIYRTLFDEENVMSYTNLKEVLSFNNYMKSISSELKKITTDFTRDFFQIDKFLTKFGPSFILRTDTKKVFNLTLDTKLMENIIFILKQGETSSPWTTDESKEKKKILKKSVKNCSEKEKEDLDKELNNISTKYSSKKGMEELYNELEYRWEMWK